MSFRSSARNRLGNQLSNFKSAAPPVQQQDSDDDNYDYDSEEEEERLLSRRHGEAEEDPNESNNNRGSSNNNDEGDKKRKPTDEEIAAEYNKNDNAKKKQRVSRRQRNITEMDLVQPNGLATIFTTFPNLFRKQNYQTNRRKDMAKFSRQLILAYQNWSNTIVPTTPLEEVAWRVQTLNSKTSVKLFLQTMRDQVRNEHVERLCGLEKAEQMLAQLDTALMEQQDYDVNDNGLENPNGQVPEGQDVEPITAATLLEEEDPAVNSPPIMAEINNSTNGPTTTNDNNNNTTNEDADLVPRNTITPTPAVRKHPRRHVLDDSSDDEELTFQDNDVPRRSAAPSMRRPVLQESDDEDDNDNDNHKVEDTKAVPPASGKDVESATMDDTGTMDEEQKSEKMEETTDERTDETVDTINPSISSEVEGEEAKVDVAEQTDNHDDEEDFDDDDDDEAEFEFETQPIHPKISTTQVIQDSENHDKSPTIQDINQETVQMAASNEVSVSHG